MKKTLHILTVIRNVRNDDGEFKYHYTKTTRIGLAFFKNAIGGMTAMQVGGIYQDIEPKTGEDRILEQLGVFGIKVKETPLDKAWAEFILDNLAQINLCGKNNGGMSLLKFFRKSRCGDEVDLLRKLLYVTAEREFEYEVKEYRVTMKHGKTTIFKANDNSIVKEIAIEKKQTDFDFVVRSEWMLHSLW